MNKEVQIGFLTVCEDSCQRRLETICASTWWNLYFCSWSNQESISLFLKDSRNKFINKTQKDKVIIWASHERCSFLKKNLMIGRKKRIFPILASSHKRFALFVEQTKTILFLFWMGMFGIVHSRSSATSGSMEGTFSNESCSFCSWSKLQGV